MTDDSRKSPTGDKIDLLFVDAHEDRVLLQRCDAEGTVLHSADGRDLDLKREIGNKASGEKYVVVMWQIERVLKDLGQNPFGSRALVDLYQLSWILASIGEIKDRKLESVAGWCGASGPYTEPTDRIRVQRECYFRLMHRFELGLKVEGIGREIMAEVTTKAATLFGQLMK